jgi:hypothetical protein
VLPARSTLPPIVVNATRENAVRHRPPGRDKVVVSG